MAYLQPAEYTDYGLPAATSADWVTAATALINSYCRRPDLHINEYTERLRIMTGVVSARLTYLPLAALAPAVSPLLRVQVRYARPRRGELVDGGMLDIACTFGLPGQWIEMDLGSVDCDERTGELTLLGNFFGLPCNEIEVSYTAGLATIGDDVKSACAQIVRNAQSTPALNARSTRMDTMQMEYFSSSLLDDTVKQWLRPYVASRVG